MNIESTSADKVQHTESISSKNAAPETRAVFFLRSRHLFHEWNGEPTNLNILFFATSSTIFPTSVPAQIVRPIGSHTLVQHVHDVAHLHAAESVAAAHGFVGAANDATKERRVILVLLVQSKAVALDFLLHGLDHCDGLAALRPLLPLQVPIQSQECDSAPTDRQENGARIPGATPATATATCWLDGVSFHSVLGW